MILRLVAIALIATALISFGIFKSLILSAILVALAFASYGAATKRKPAI